MSLRKKSRLELLQLRRKKTLVAQGVKILSAKRDALMKEFRGLVRRTFAAREKLARRMEEAGKSLTLARAFTDTNTLATAASAAQRGIAFTASAKNVWGVRIPEIAPPNARRNHWARGSAPGWRHPAVEETADRFEEAINALAESALTENRLAIIGGAVKATSRRVNALEMVVVPEIKGEMAAIQSHLEELAREDMFRLKRYKALKQKPRR